MDLSAKQLFGTLEAAGLRRGPVRSILVVDDSRTNLDVLGRRLAQLGYLTVLSDNGADALDLIATRGFDLVLLDMVMPGMSGVQVLREIRASRDTVDLPVIMVTGRDDPAAAVEALTAGADDHVAKPYAFEVLAARIDRVLGRARRITELQRDAGRADRGPSDGARRSENRARCHPRRSPATDRLDPGAQRGTRAAQRNQRCLMK